MIRSFSCERTQALFAGRCPARFRAFRAAAERKLAQLHAATTLEFLRSPPGNRLEALHGDRTGTWSIRINAQWRLCFLWRDGDAHEVHIIDYH